MTNHLTPDQEKSLISFKCGNNIFLTGPGGSGKSYLIKTIVDECKKSERKVQVCATTGCAAILLNCGAKTLHSWGGFGLGNCDVKTVVKRVTGNKYKKKHWKDIDVLIIDEVMTGFRISQQGAIGHYGIDADLICLGKVIGGGMPVGAFGGKHEIMQQIAPLGPVYQAGTLSGNPVAMAAGLATLELISQSGFLEPVIERTDRLVKGLVERATAAGIPMTSNHVGTMWGVFFSTEEKIINYDQVMQCDTERFAKFFHGMLEEGVYLAPASYEAGFMSAAHTDQDIEDTLNAAERVFARI